VSLGVHFCRLDGYAYPSRGLFLVTGQLATIGGVISSATCGEVGDEIDATLIRGKKSIRYSKSASRSARPLRVIAIDKVVHPRDTSIRVMTRREFSDFAISALSALTAMMTARPFSHLASRVLIAKRDRRVSLNVYLLPLRL
jgi:hypothetical protein